MQGIIYKVQPYLEHGKLLFVYTPSGKKTLVAQGAQKLNSNDRFLTQYLTKIEFEEENKNFHRLKNAKLIDDYQKIKNEFDLTKNAALILEIIDHAVDEHLPHEAIYKELDRALSTKNINLSSISFSIKMLKYLGYELNFNASGKTIIGFNIKTGSLVYEKEDLTIDLPTKDVVDLLKLAKMPYLELPDIELSNIKEFIKDYYLYHLQMVLKNI